MASATPPNANQRNGGASTDAAAPPAGPAQMQSLAQYIKDLSFENPNAPVSLQQQQGPSPQISIQVQVNAKAIAQSDYEIELRLEGHAGDKPKQLFAFELIYSGIFRLVNIPQEHVHGAIMIEGPRLLFPFARQIIADCVRNGGFPPLYIDPIDFVALYQQRAAEAQAKSQAPQLA